MGALAGASGVLSGVGFCCGEGVFKAASGGRGGTHRGEIMERFGALRVISHGFQASTARFRCLSLGSSSVRGRGLALQASQELLEVRLLHTVAEVDAVLGEKHLASSWSS